MSSIDGINKDEINNTDSPESISNPEIAKSPEEFRESLQGNKEHIVESVRGNDDWNDLALALSDRYSPAELKDKIKEVGGDVDELAQKYEDAVFGDYKNDEEKYAAIEDASKGWANAVEKTEVYKMALDAYDEPMGGGVTETSERNEMVESSKIPDGIEKVEQNESVDNYQGGERGGREMTREDKESYGISQEIEDFVATGKPFDVLLPSQMSKIEGDGEFSKKETTNTNNENPSVKEKIMAGLGMAMAIASGGIDAVNLQSVEIPSSSTQIEAPQSPIRDFAEILRDGADGIADLLKKREESKEDDGLYGR